MSEGRCGYLRNGDTAQRCPRPSGSEGFCSVHLCGNCRKASKASTVNVCQWCAEVYDNGQIGPAVYAAAPPPRSVESAQAPALAPRSASASQQRCGYRRAGTNGKDTTGRSCKAVVVSAGFCKSHLCQGCGERGKSSKEEVCSTCAAAPKPQSRDAAPLPDYDVVDTMPLEEAPVSRELCILVDSSLNLVLRS